MLKLRQDSPKLALRGFSLCWFEAGGLIVSVSSLKQMRLRRIKTVHCIVTYTLATNNLCNQSYKNWHSNYSGGENSP